MRLLIVRHGETIQNAKKIVGHIHDQLSKLGKKQVKKLTKRLAKEKIDIIYCSDLKRCKQTIKPLLKIKKAPIIYTKELRERNFGIFNGKPLHKLKAWLEKRRIKNAFYTKIPEGESYKDLYKRTMKFIKKIIKKEKGKNVLLVAHGGLKKALLKHLLKKDDAYFKKTKLANTSLTIIKIKEKGKHRARLINSTKHLED